MDTYQFALLMGACIVGLASLGDPRALIWLALGATDFAVTSAYFQYHPAFHPFVAALVDAGVVCIIDVKGWHRWEIALKQVFMAQMLVNILTFFGAINDHVFQAIALEALNWLALAVIGGPRLMRHLDGLAAKVAHGSRANRAVHRLVHKVYARRAKPAFWSAPG